MQELFEYLHLLNEALSANNSDSELYERRQKVCDVVEKSLGIQPIELEKCGIPKTIVNNYYSTTNRNYHNPDLSKLVEKLPDILKRPHGKLI